jgi:membrane protein YdbS with pleckstrin-like domain
MATQSDGIWESAIDPLWDAIGLAGAIVLGVILFFFPEPATSILGAIIIVAAALVWLGIDLRQEVRYTRGMAERGQETEREEHEEMGMEEE